MDSNSAAAVLAETRSIRTQTRSTMHAMWFPLVLFGVLTLASAGVSWRNGAEALGLFWLVAGPIGTVITFLFYWRWENRIGLDAPRFPSLFAVAVIVIGCFGTGVAGGILDAPRLATAGPPLAISIGYLLFAWMGRSVALGVTALALAVLDVGLLVAGVGVNTLATALSASYGTAFLGIGLAEVIRHRLAP